MARKKRMKRTARRTTRKKSKVVHHKAKIRSRISVVLNNLLLFVALSLVSLVLARYLTNTFFVNLFSVMAMVFGFMSVAFLITLLVLWIMKLFSKKKRR